MTNIYNLFKFLEDKKGREVPLEVKIILKPNEITSDDVNGIYNKGVIKHKGPHRFIKHGKLYFLLDEGGNISINNYFNSVDYKPFDGYLKIFRKNSGYNFLNTKGEMLINNLWFDMANRFIEGFAVVYIKNKGWGFINTKGEMLKPKLWSNLWFDEVDDFYGGTSRVIIAGMIFYIDTEGKLYHSDMETKVTPLTIEKIKHIKKKQTKINESVQIKQIINQIINENFQNDINNLKRFGYELIDKEIINNYILFLVKEPREGLYEIGITSNDREFTTPQSQEKIIATERGGEFSTARGFQKTIRNWLNNYSPIYVGSLNKNKTFKYHRILDGLGFNVGRINHDDPVHLGGNQVFPESWNFIIS